MQLAKRLERHTLVRPYLTQVIRSSSSIGANYLEADEAESKKDFRHKVAIARKEARESGHWLALIREAVPSASADCEHLVDEVDQLTRILSAIIRKLDSS